MIFRWILLWALFSPFTQVRAEKWTAFSVRKPVSILRADRESLIPSRGMVLGNKYQIVVGAKGGIVFDSEFGGTLSVIGPAMLTTQKIGPDFVIFRVEYGDVYFRKNRKDVAALETPYFRAYGESREFQLYLEAPLGGNFFRVRNLSSSLDLGNRFLEEGLTLSRAGVAEDVLPNRAEDVQLCRARHLNNRYNQELSAPVDKPYDPNAVDNLSGLVEFYPFAGTTKFLVSNSNIGQYTGFAGVSVKLGTHLFLNLPKEPRRIDFIQSQLVRAGLDLGVFSGNFHFAAGSFQRPSLLYAAFFAGASYQGLGMDFFVGRPYRIGAGSDTSYKISMLYGADVEYRIDLHDFSGSETGFALGIRTLVLPLTNISAELRETAGLAASRVKTINLAPFVGLSMRF